MTQRVRGSDEPCGEPVRKERSHRGVRIVCDPSLRGYWGHYRTSIFRVSGRDLRASTLKGLKRLIDNALDDKEKAA